MSMGDETRRDAERMLANASRGLIDDSSIDVPDDEELAEVKRTARAAAERRRAAARIGAVARRRTRAA